MAANVTIHHTAFSDRRIAYLGELAGYSTMEALGRLAALWSRCTELQNDRPGVYEIRACLGPRGEQYLIESGLGEEIEGDIRVRGCEGRHEWYGEVGPGAPRQTAGGKARAAQGQRDAKGRLLPSSKTTPASPVAGEMLEVVGPATVQQPSNRPASESESGSETEDPKKLSPAGAPAIPPDQRKSLRDATWALVNAKRAEFQDTRPLHFHDPGYRELAARILESGANAQANIDHVLAIAFAEADAKGTPEYLCGSMFEQRSWSKKLSLRVQDVTKSRTGPRRAGELIGAADPRTDHPISEAPRFFKDL